MIVLYGQKLQYSNFECCQIAEAHWLVARKSKPIVRREHTKVQQYYSKMAVEDLRDERFIKLTMDFGSTTDLNFDKISDSLILSVETCTKSKKL